MHFCDLTLPSAAENLACDEALLDLAEEGQGRGGETLRVWEPREHFVVLGYGNKAETEVNLAYCRDHGIGVHRRCSGGGTVLQGPGTINYSVILRIDPAGPCYSISDANRFVMGRQQLALSTLLGQPVEISGCTDLSIGGLKFSGNAQRRKSNFLLFHGSFLLNLDLTLMERILPFPSKEPDYRGGRSHSDFLTNLKVSPASIRKCMQEIWSARSLLPSIPEERIARLVGDKYSREEWNLKF